MSETECNTGKLIPVKLLNGESNEGFAFRTCKQNSIKKEEYNKTYLEQLLSDREWFLFDGVLYKVENDRDCYNGDILQATKNTDGTINYVLQYYNGGCSFTEAMEYALKKIK